MSNKQKPPIQVWRFEDAPAELRAMSDHGGDEDWVALVPLDCVDPEMGPEWVPGWAEDGTPFGCCSVSRFKLDDGSLVLIGSHA